MNSSSVTVRQRGVGLGCRPIGQKRLCLRRSVESAHYASSARGCWTLRVSADAAAPHGRQNGRKPTFFLGQRRNPERDGLSAGGNWIRNSSSALSSVVSRISEIRNPSETNDPGVAGRKPLVQLISDVRETDRKLVAGG